MGALPGYLKRVPGAPPGKHVFRIRRWHPSYWLLVARSAWEVAPVLYVFPLLAFGFAVLILLRIR
jgi:hypothetical protein